MIAIRNLNETTTYPICRACDLLYYSYVGVLGGAGCTYGRHSPYTAVLKLLINSLVYAFTATDRD